VLRFFIIVSLFLYSHNFAQKDYNILSSSNNSLIIEYKPVYLKKSEVSIQNNNYINIDLLNGSNGINNGIGSPIIPIRVLSVGVPSELGNSIRIISSDYKTIKGKIKPQPNIRKINNFPSYQYIENEKYVEYENPELVSFGEFGLVRDLNIQSINISPVQFESITQEIKLYSRIVFQINFSKANNLQKLSKSELTKNLVINWKIASNWGSEAKLSKKSAVKNSVLANGDWHRFEAPEEGIYKIDRTFLTGLGIDIDDVDPRTIKIYNNGGYVLSWTPSATRPNDLIENTIIVEGEDDGSFDSNDLILFYGRGVDFWEYNSISDKITRNKHSYSKKNYYWLTYGGSNGKRMEIQSSVDGTPDLVQSTTQAYRFQDNDNQNLIGSGLLHVDDDFSSSSQSKTYAHMLDGLVAGSTINYTFQFVNGSTHSNTLKIDENGTEIFSRSISGSSSSYQEYRYGALTRNLANYSNTLPDKRSVLKFTYNPTSISDKGHLDFLEIEYKQDLKTQSTNLPIVFFSEEVDGLVKFEGSPFSNSSFKVYNISDFANPKIINLVPNGGGFSFSSSESSDFSSKYLAIHDDDVKVPQSDEKIVNSDIHGFISGAQYIIISPREFEEQAVRLMNYRENEAQFKTTGFIAYIDEIYNEFSGGSLDPTAIRDFLKYAFDNWDVQPEYVLLFGDGDYDYFNILGKNVNYIPTFQTTESLYEINSYPFDDYYSRISGNDNLVDIGIGRLCITSIEEAEIVVDKVINYETKLNKGLWRNKITLLADDGLAGFENGSVKNDGTLHTNQSENLSSNHIPKKFDQNKIYLSNFQTNNTGLGRRKPDCNTAVIDAINNGTLIFNYVGHGNPDVWAHEIVFDRSISIPQLRNKELFFLTAATCDFGKYDDPNLQSATEEMILMENAGMIGGLSAVRPVFSGQNDALNRAFYNYMLGEEDSLGIPIPIGKAYHKLKQQRSSDNDEKFHLFADPLLRLNIPKLPVEITSINDAGLMDTVNVKALSEITIKGKVLNSNRSDSQFDGEGIITVFDSERKIHLDDINYDMTDQGGVIFRGRVSFENGNFATSFTVPKDISYENKNGKIIAYFFNDEIDGVGFTNNIIVGGTDSTRTNDGSGPEIEILYDDESESSYLVSPNFRLRVKLNDGTGLNTTGTGIGHKLEAILNEDEQNSIDLTNYFVGDLNSGGKSGEVNYNFSSMEPGEYKIEVNAWDVYNNFSSQEDYFTVVDDNDLVIREVYNYPNPFSSNTYFTFQHNFNEALNVKVKVYTIAGRVIKEIESINIEDKFVKIEWDGKDDDNNKIGNGTYLYKLIVETVDGVYKENILGKMAVIR
jgi:Peptidase family C25/Propeptide_C25/FlgD Ig-like domain